MSKSIHVLGAGGPAGVGITRCLKNHYVVTGSDASLWSSLMMEVPPVSDLGFDCMLPIPDAKVKSLAGAAKTFLPPIEQIELCQNKADTAELLGEIAPKTYWVRDTEGTGGAGAQMISAYLPGKNFSAEFVYKDGVPIAKFQKLRVSYSVKHRTAGIENRGSSAVSIATSNENVFTIAEEALNILSSATGTLLNGFYGVDLKYDEDNYPKVTEINAGRLLTASYSYFHLTGYNLPLLGMQAFFGDDLSPLPDYPVGFGIIKQIGQEPRLFDPAITNEWYADSN